MSIFAKLLDVQSELKAPKNKDNTFGKYKYRSAEDILEAVKPLLKKHGLTQIMSDEIIEIEGRFYVKATINLFDEKGMVISTTALAREPENKKGMDESQITGTASSYARKYALNGMYAIDDTKDADTDEYHNEINSRTKKQNKGNDDKASLISEIGVIAKSRGLNREDLQKVIIDVTGKVITSTEMNIEQLTKLRDELLKLE